MGQRNESAMKAQERGVFFRDDRLPFEWGNVAAT